MNLITERYNRYGHEISTRDLLKAIAAITMILDHIGWLFMDNDPYLRSVGRFAAPVYFFLIGNAKSYKFSFPLLVYGAIVSVFVSLHTEWYQIDILISFLVIRYFLRYAPDGTWKAVPLFLILFFCMATHVQFFKFIAYGTLGLLWAMTGYLNKTNNKNIYWFLPLVIMASYYYLISGFNPPAELVFDLSYLTILTLFGVIALTFTISPLRHIPIVFSPQILFLSRFSLEIYAIHLCLFIVVNWIIF
jgi:hypothetical protein